MKTHLSILFLSVFGFLAHVDGSSKDYPSMTYLGVYATQVDPNLSHQLNLPENLYLSVQKVEKGSPAEKSGIQQFDLLLQLDDQILINQEQLKYLVRSKKPEDEVTLSFLRQGVKKSTQLILGEIKQEYEVTNDEDLLENDLFSNRNPLDLNGFLHNDFKLQELFPYHSFRNVPNLKHNYGRLRNVRTVDDSDEDPLNKKSVSKSFTRQSINSQIMISDEKGTLEWSERDGQKSLRATDPNGKVIFDGPITTDKERKTLSPELMTQLKRLEKNIKSP